MANNCEVVNKTICKKCFEHHKQITGQEPIDCAFKAFDNEYCDEAQELANYVTNLQSQLDQQKSMWNELKEWLNKEADHVRYTPYDCKSLSSDFELWHLNKILEKMQELEDINGQ